MGKSADAFRTISEVADWLETPAHVLRFWESKFSQVKPVKRAGGRRYYRPADMKLLGGIKKLLHDDGMTIKGVQKMLREQGVGHVSEFSQPLGDAADDVIIDHVEDAYAADSPDPVADTTSPEAQPATTDAVPRPAPPASVPAASTPEPNAPPPQQSPVAVPDPAPLTPSAAPEPAPVASSLPPRPDPPVAETETPPSETPKSASDESPLTFSRNKTEAEQEPEKEQETETERPQEDAPPLPSFLKRRNGSSEASAASGTVDGPTAEPEPASAEPPALQPIQVDVPDDPDDGLDFDPGVLSMLARVQRPLTPDTITSLEGLLSRLRATTGSTPRE